MVDVWATEVGIPLGQLKVDAKSNEITAVSELLDTLAIEGCLMTADAMSCQKMIAEKKQKKGANYLLAVKKNQRKLYGEIDLLKYDTTVKLGIKIKRNECGWSETYLCHVLGLIK